MNIRISKRKLFIIIIIFFITMPVYLYTNFRYIGTLMALVQYYLFGLMILNMIRTRFKGASPVFWMLLLTVIVEIISSYRNPLAMPTDAIKIGVKTVGWIWLMDKELKRDSEFFVKAYTFFQVIYVIMNFLTLIIFPNGMYQSGAYSSCYFLGYDNTHINVQLPAIALITIRSIWKYGKVSVKAWGFILIVLISTLITFSATSVVGISIFIGGLIIIFPRKKKKNYKLIKIPSPLSSFTIFGIISALFIGGSTFAGLKERLLNLFGKDATLAARTLIWENSLLNISKEFVWGYGYESGETISSKLVNISGQAGWGLSPHNFYLAILYTGGIVLFITVIITFIMVNHKYSIATNTVVKMIIGLWIFSFMCMCVVESHYGNSIRTLLLFSYYILKNETQKELCGMSRRCEGEI